MTYCNIAVSCEHNFSETLQQKRSCVHKILLCYNMSCPITPTNFVESKWRQEAHLHVMTNNPTKYECILLKGFREVVFTRSSTPLKPYGGICSYLVRIVNHDM
jgi:hypothetical protein